LGLDYNRLYFHEGNKALSGLLLGRSNPRFKVHETQMETHAENVLSEGTPVAEKFKSMQDEDFLNNGFINAKTMIVSEVQNITRRHAFLNPEAADKEGYRNLASIIQRFRAQAKRAKKSIDITSPYLYLTEDEIAFFKQWLSEDSNRKLRIMTNSVMSGDNMPAQAVFDSKIAPALKLSPEFKDLQKQIEIYEFGKLDGTELGGSEIYGKVHAKFAIIDGETTLVTSSNADERSRNLNSEVGAIILKSPEFSKKYVDYMNSLIDRSYAWGSPEYQELRDHPKIKFKKLQEDVLTKVLRYLNLTPLI
ncbi:MAG: phospholipase D-like domain-containing protein, partial [Bdellovibrionia bacterium]